MTDPTRPEDIAPDEKPHRDDDPKARPAPEVVSVDAGIPWGLIFFLILSVLMAVFAVQNTQDVELEFLGWSGEFPLIMIIVGVFVTAVVLDEILGTILRRRRRTRRLEKQELERYRKQK
jgi:uncharacterized integral membrane protein